MLRLAVTTDAETYDRMSDPLADRDIEVEYVQTAGRTVSLTDARSFDPDRFDVGYVFPPRLMEGGVADALLEVPWLNGREAVLTSRNKAEVLARCARVDVPTPETVLVSNPADEADVRAAIERVGVPAVIKPNSTTRGVGIAKVDDPDSALGVTDYLDLVHDFRATGDRSYLVQEFVPGARDLRAMTIEGEYVGAVERRLSDEQQAGGRWKHNVHRGAIAEPVELDAEARTLVETVATLLGIDLLGVDLLVTDERTLVSETNARPTIDDEEKYEPSFYDRLAAAIERTAENG